MPGAAQRSAKQRWPLPISELPAFARSRCWELFRKKSGSACAQALGAMECSEAVSQLTRMRAKVKYNVARRLIEKSLQQAAERSGLTVQELEDISVGNYGLNAQGEAQIAIGDAKAVVRLGEDGHVGVAWRSADGKLVKAAPSHVKKAFPKEVRAVASLAKELEQIYLAQRTRLESSFVLPRGMPVAHWRQYFVEHPVLGFLGRRLIWVFKNDQGWECSGIWSGQEACSIRREPRLIWAPRKPSGSGIRCRRMRRKFSDGANEFSRRKSGSRSARRFASSTSSRTTSARPGGIPIASPKC